jgi:hypothetical protein
MDTNKAAIATIILMILLTLTQQVSAADLPSYFDECKQVAIRKLESKARLNEASIVSIELYASDLIWYKPSKYFLFLAKAITKNGTEIELETVTQKPFLPPGECF